MDINEYLLSLETHHKRANAILNNLYHVKAKLLAEPSRYLADIEFAKIRYKVEKKFPALIDLSGVRKYELLEFCVIYFLAFF
jgi:hypothetical protein